MSRAFTLVELMIVVAIMMVLAAVAIPLFAEFQLKARRAEVYPNLDGIQKAYDGYLVENGSVTGLSTGWTIDPALANKSLHAFAGDAGWTALGWTPDGWMRGAYVLDAPGCDAVVQRLTAVIDADDNDLFYHYVAQGNLPAGQSSGTWTRFAGCSASAGNVCGSGSPVNCY